MEAALDLIKWSRGGSADRAMICFPSSCRPAGALRLRVGMGGWMVCDVGLLLVVSFWT